MLGLIWSMSYEVQSHNSLSSGASCQVTFGFINDLDLISMVCWLCSVPVRWHSNYRYCKPLELLAAQTLIPFRSFQHHQNAKLWIEKPEKWWWGKMQKDPSWGSLSLAMTSLFMTDWFERTNKWVGTFQIMLFFPQSDTFYARWLGTCHTASCQGQAFGPQVVWVPRSRVDSGWTVAQGAEKIIKRAWSKRGTVVAEDPFQGRTPHNKYILKVYIYIDVYAYLYIHM